MPLFFPSSSRLWEVGRAGRGCCKKNRSISKLYEPQHEIWKEIKICLERFPGKSPMEHLSNGRERNSRVLCPPLGINWTPLVLDPKHSQVRAWHLIQAHCRCQGPRDWRTSRFHSGILACTVQCVKGVGRAPGDPRNQSGDAEGSHSAGCRPSSEYREVCAPLGPHSPPVMLETG